MTTATFVLVPGADGRAWYWHLVVPALRALGHDVVAVDLPAADSAGLAEFAGAVVEAIGDRSGLVLVAQSLAGWPRPAGSRTPSSICAPASSTTYHRR